MSRPPRWLSTISEPDINPLQPVVRDAEENQTAGNWSPVKGSIAFPLRGHIADAARS